MSCKNCKTDKILSVNGKCSDMCFAVYDGYEHDGYVPNNLGIGGGDYIEFKLCLNCGQVQDTFPKTPPNFNGKEEIE
jgi:hypothetical protein